jgi:pentatricopeptide repeat domain-containing protein 1
MLAAGAVEPSLIAINAAMAGCERAKQWQKALELLERTIALGLKPDVITFNTAISALAKGGEWQTALSLLGGMRSRGIRPDRIRYVHSIYLPFYISADTSLKY